MLLHVVDEFTREALAIECRRRIDADTAVAVLDRMVLKRGCSPRFIRCDNGPELTANALRGLVPVLPRWERVHRARLAVAERLRRVLRFTHPRRAARRRDLLLPRRGAGHARGPPPGLQRAPATLSPRACNHPSRSPERGRPTTATPLPRNQTTTTDSQNRWIHKRGPVTPMGSMSARSGLRLMNVTG